MRSRSRTARRRRATSTRCSTCATGSSASACACSATRPRCTSRAGSRSSATSSARTSSTAAARSARTRRLAHLFAPVDQHAHTPVPAGGHAVSTPELVRVTIDELDVHVPKGTGLVETALAAGIEIPVFCYEPRLGAPIGACRMCLVEIEGMPKLQTGCTLTAQDGMVVKTARTSAKAARGPERDARVHPRQPSARLPRLRQGRRVPAAGPDVPLRARQHAHDASRSVTFEKPIPISPTISLDRERCILCYRCTRFSDDGERGRPARREEPRRDVGDHDVRRRAVHGRVQRQRHRALPRRRAAADAVPLRGAAVGDPRASRPCAACAPSAATRASTCARAR